MRRRVGCAGTEYLFYFGKCLDCYSTLLTLPWRLNTLECGWHILAFETNGKDSDYRHKWPSNSVRAKVKLNRTICQNWITWCFGLKWNRQNKPKKCWYFDIYLSVREISTKIQKIHLKRSIIDFKAVKIESAMIMSFIVLLTIEATQNYIRHHNTW